MSLRKFALSLLLAHAEARFGQEHPAAINEITAVTSGGQPGQAATIGGGAISNLLASANPCTKYQTGDNIIASLGDGADAVKAAQDFVHAEQNFNPFNQDVPTLCSDPTLPTTAVLRGILPLIDPAVGGSDVANQLANQSLTTPFASTGMSIAQIFAANGFSNFTTEDLAGNKGNAPAGSVPVGNDTSTAPDPNASAPDTSATPDSSVGECGAALPSAAQSSVAAAPTTLATVASAAPTAVPSSTLPTAANSSATSGLVGPAAQQAAEADPTIGTNAKTTLNVDFGSCVPTMFFANLRQQTGSDGQPIFTFQAVQPSISSIQQDALNPNIITNRICDELTNQCNADQPAKDVCQQAKAQISALGTKDQSTADAWNQALGF